MMDHYAYQLALRAKAMTLQVATTGTISLSAATTGYTRHDGGSFITDGFHVGMEVVATGFSQAVNNAAKAITGVTASELACSGCVTEGQASGRTLSIPLPELRGWENVSIQPVAGRPYIVEHYLPGPMSRETLGPLGELEVRPMYVIDVFAVATVGLASSGKYVDALLTLFAPGTEMTASNGDVIRVRSDTGPFRSQLMFDSPGWVQVSVTIPVRVRTTNVI